MKFSTTLSTLFTLLSFSLEVNSFQQTTTRTFVPSSSSSSSSTSSTRFPKRFSLSMGNELQEKDDQTSILKQKVHSTNTELNSGKVGYQGFPAVGGSFGMDERFSMFPTDKQFSDESNKLSNMETNFYKHTLLIDISSDEMGSLEKLEKVRFASIVGLLSETDTQSFNFKAGGLMNDWSFSFE